MKYLYKRGNYYYFVKRIKNKIVKYSLKSNNLKYCIILRDKILERLKMNENNDFFNDVREELNNRSLSDFNAKSMYTVKLTVTPDNENETEEQCKKISEELIKKMYKGQIDESIAVDTNSETSKNIIANLDSLYIDFMKHKQEFNNVSNHSIQSYKSSLTYLKYFIKEDTIFNFNYFKQMQNDFKVIPSNFFKYDKYHTKTIEELKVLKEKDNYTELNNKTINKHLINYNSFFDYLVYIEMINDNPVAKIKNLTEQKINVKMEYTKEELDLIFNSDMDTKHLYFCKFGIYTGLRIEEICQLKKTDIDLENNLIKINMNDTSNKKHTRNIPIHKNISNIINYQLTEDIENEYLFFDSNKNAIGKRVNNRLRKIVSNKSKSFHSLRYNFSQEIEETASEEKIKKYLMAHNLDKDTTHNIYNRGKINIDKLRECINSIKFKY